MRQLLIVSGVIFFLTFFILLNTSEKTKCSKFLHARLEIIEIQKALEFFQNDKGNLPSAEMGLAVLVEPNNQYLISINYDAWHNAYIYKRTTNAPGYILYSIGKNGIDEQGEGDDITTWEKQYTYADYGIGFPGTMYDLIPSILALLFLLSLLFIIICSIIYLIKFMKYKNRA